MFLDPTNDVAFRRIFGNENKKNILISFLNSVLGFSGDKEIVDVALLNTNQVPKIIGLKETILDVRCTDQRGISYIVEMQIAKPSQFEKRVLYYTSKAYTNQIESGDQYPALNQVIFIGIVNFNMFEGEHYISNHLILDEATGVNKLQDFRFCFVELPKFNLSEDELQTVAEKWIYFFKNAKDLQIIPSRIKDQNIIDAFDVLERYGWTKQELELYDTIAIYRQDERGRVEEGYNISDIIRDFKKFTSKKIIALIKDNIQESRRDWMLNRFEYAARNDRKVKEYKFWQEGVDCQEIYLYDYLQQKLNYIHNNPIKEEFVYFFYKSILK